MFRACVFGYAFQAPVRHAAKYMNEVGTAPLRVHDLRFTQQSGLHQQHAPSNIIMRLIKASRQYRTGHLTWAGYIDQLLSASTESDSAEEQEEMQKEDPFAASMYLCVKARRLIGMSNPLYGLRVKAPRRG